MMKYSFAVAKIIEGIQVKLSSLNKSLDNLYEEQKRDEVKALEECECLEKQFDALPFFKKIFSNKNKEEKLKHLKLNQRYRQGHINWDICSMKSDIQELNNILQILLKQNSTEKYILSYDECIKYGLNEREE